MKYPCVSAHGYFFEKNEKSVDIWEKLWYSVKAVRQGRMDVD